MRDFVFTASADGESAYHRHGDAGVVQLIRDGVKITAFVDRRATGDPRIVELRVAPLGATSDRPSRITESVGPDLSAQLGQAHAAVREAAGARIDTRTLRGIRLGDVDKFVGAAEASAIEAAELHPQATATVTVGGRVIDLVALRQAWRALGRDESPAAAFRWLSAALVYATAIAEGSARPNQRVAADLGITVSAAQTLVHRARRAGLLTSVDTRGRTGGELTEGAWRLLAAAAGAERT
jgi:hypothetical protein